MEDLSGGGMEKWETEGEGRRRREREVKREGEVGRGSDGEW